MRIQASEITDYELFLRVEIQCGALFLFYLGDEYAAVDGIQLLPVASLHCGSNVRHLV
jgi:hypothetical protein